MGVRPMLTTQDRSSNVAEAGTVLASPQGPVVEVDGRRVINFSSSNYLGLATDGDILRAAHTALDEQGYGMAAGRVLSGTHRVHRELERELAAFLAMDGSLLYTSCFDANGGLFEVLLDESDAVFSDAFNHASIIDGIRLCRARRHV